VVTCLISCCYLFYVAWWYILSCVLMYHIYCVMCKMTCCDVSYDMWLCLFCHVVMFFDVVIYLIVYGHIFWVVLCTEVALWYYVYNVKCHTVSYVMCDIFKCGYVAYGICGDVTLWYIFSNYDELMFLIWWCDVKMVMWHNMSDSCVSHDILIKFG